MEVSFIHTQILVHLHVNKPNFHMKGFALGFALKQRRNATRKSPIAVICCSITKSAAKIELSMQNKVPTLTLPSV